MTELEMTLVCFINEFHRKVVYRYEKYQMLHGVAYQKNLDKEYLEKIRNAYPKNCFGAACELKTYYAENGILSNTIVLKMRPISPELQEFRLIKVHSDIADRDYEYTHHAIEVFKEHGKYKVLDVLHADRAVWLEAYLDGLCRVNGCERNQLRYDLGYLAPCHAFADNMQELSDLMRYLDKTYLIGDPRGTYINLGGMHSPDAVMPTEGMLLSDDVAMDFDEFGRAFGCTGKELIYIYQSVYDRLMKIRFNMLHILCLGHIMRDPIMKYTLAKGIFDDNKIIELVEESKRLW